MASEGGKGGVKPGTDWEAIYPANERGLEAATVALLSRQDLIDHMGWPPILAIFRQFRLGRSIADILLDHEDKSVTLIEVKQAGMSLRDYCTGIGQLAYQTIMAISYFQAREVRKVLATPGPVPVDIVIACAAADVDILPTMTIEQWREWISESEALRTH